MPETRDGDSDLLRRYGAGDLGARDQLAKRYMPLARWLARRHRDSGSALEDLEQVAYVGLLKSIDRFDPDVGKFSAYAASTIRGELLRYFRDSGWGVRVPRPLQEDYVTVKRARERLTVELGRAPGLHDLARRTGLDPDRVGEALNVACAYRPDSLHAPFGDDDPGTAVIDTVGRHDTGFDAVELRSELAAGWSRLTGDQRQSLRMRLVEDMTHSEIAHRLGVSQMTISRWLRKALAELEEASAA